MLPALFIVLDITALISGTFSAVAGLIICSIMQEILRDPVVACDGYAPWSSILPLVDLCSKG